MAATIVASTVVTSGGTAGSGQGNPPISVAAPSGLTQGDLELLYVIIGVGQGSTFTTPSGWTQLFQDNLNTGSVTGRHAAWWRIAPASPGSVDVSWDSYARHYVGVRQRITGHNATAPINVTGALSSGAAASNSSPSFTVGAATTTMDDCLALAMLGWMWGAFDPPPPYGTPSGWGGAGFNTQSHNNTNRPSGCMFQKAVASVGTTGTVVITPQNMWTSDPENRSWGGRIVAIAPGSALPPPLPATGRVRTMWV